MAVFDEQLTSRAFWHSPYPVYRRLLEEAPVYWSEAWGAWLLTRYDDVVETLRDNRRFTSLGRLTKPMQPALEEPLSGRSTTVLSNRSSCTGYPGRSWPDTCGSSQAIWEPTRRSG